MKVTSTIDLEKQIDSGWMWFLLSKFWNKKQNYPQNIFLKLFLSKNFKNQNKKTNVQPNIFLFFFFMFSRFYYLINNPFVWLWVYGLNLLVLDSSNIRSNSPRIYVVCHC